MMKKLFLLFASSVVAVGVHAQTSNRSMVYLGSEGRQEGAKPEAVAGRAIAKSAATANKGTAPTKRVYNYVDYLNLLNSAILDPASTGYLSLPYMWFKPDMKAIYAGPTLDTINFASYGVVLHPFWNSFNDPQGYPGEMAIATNNAYTVDSIVAYGAYGRNPAKTGIVDTLRFAFSYGTGSNTTNISAGTYGGTLPARYNTDTLRTTIMTYDSVNNRMGRPTTSTGPAIVIKDYLLRAGDTASQRFAVASALNVPAGNLVGVSVTFRSGENYTPWDTVFRSTTINPDVPFKYGMFRPFVYKESLTNFPTYSKTNFNVGNFKVLPDAVGRDYYSPTWAWEGTGGTPGAYQFPYIDFNISCPTCFGVNVGNISTVKLGSAFPNPANNAITLPVTAKENAVVSVSLTSVVGQVIATQNMGQVSANATKNATFSTAGLSNGVYFLTVEANGARTTSRFVVAH